MPSRTTWNQNCTFWLSTITMIWFWLVPRPFLRLNHHCWKLQHYMKPQGLDNTEPRDLPRTISFHIKVANIVLLKVISRIFMLSEWHVHPCTTSIPNLIQKPTIKKISGQLYLLAEGARIIISRKLNLPPSQIDFCLNPVNRQYPCKRWSVW